MKYRWLLGLMTSLMASCSNDDSGNATGSGGTSGQTSSSGGSTTQTGGSGGAKATTGGTSPGSGGSKGGGAATGGTAPTGGAQNGGSGNNANGGSGNTATGGAAPGTGGNAGGGGNPPSGGTGGAPPTMTGGSVLERNGGPTREGHWVQPALTKAAAAKMAMEANFKATFSGSMYASPLFAANGPGGKGVFIAVSASNEVAALDETTGATVWSKSLGGSPGANGQACDFGNDPVGILSTPVIDEKSRTIFLSAAMGSGAVEKHEIHALSLDDGASKTGWPVDAASIKAGGLSFNAEFQNQRSALSLVNGIVYVAFGGFVGDCGDYRGWVTAIDASDPTKSGAWATASKGEAIWAAGGFASDGTSIFPVTGNAVTPLPSSRDNSNSEAVLRITGLAQFEKSAKNEFYPTSWKSMDSADADLGGSNSILITVPGSTPEKLIIAVAKDGQFYLLDPNNLGGGGGEVVALAVASGGGGLGAIKTAPTAYSTSKGTYVAITVDSGSNCPNNMTGKVIMGVKINPGAPPTADVAWCAQGQGQGPSTAPIATTTDGKADAIVWYIANGQLRGVDGDTGDNIYSGMDNCGTVNRWTSPIAVKGRIVAGANGKLCSWAPAQ